MIIEFKGMRPDVEKATFIADSATLSGDVHLAENTSVWFGASVRAEVASITIGRDSNVQDNAMLHADYDLPITIGERVSVGTTPSCTAPPSRTTLLWACMPRL